MKAKNLIVTVSVAVSMFAAAGSVMANELYGNFGDPALVESQFAATASRAAVRSELKQAQENGSYIVGELTPEVPSTSTKTRAEVRAELEQAKADGSYDIAHQMFEGQYPAATARTGSRLAGNTNAAKATKAN